jgi:hypothetical protein
MRSADGSVLVRSLTLPGVGSAPGRVRSEGFTLARSPEGRAEGASGAAVAGLRASWPDSDEPARGPAETAAGVGVAALVTTPEGKGVAQALLLATPAGRGVAVTAAGAGVAVSGIGAGLTAMGGGVWAGKGGGFAEAVGVCAVKSDAARASASARTSSPASPADSAARRNHRNASATSPLFQSRVAVSSAVETSSASFGSGLGMLAMLALPRGSSERRSRRGAPHDSRCSAHDGKCFPKHAQAHETHRHRVVFAAPRECSTARVSALNHAGACSVEAARFPTWSASALATRLPRNAMFAAAGLLDCGA